MSHKAFLRALAHFDGNQSEMARALDWTQQMVSYTVRRQKSLPAELVVKAESITGIPRHVLRPDVFPVEQGRAA